MKALLLAVVVVSAPVQAQTPPPAAAAPETWLARPGVEIAGLDKITARVTQLVGRVGQTLSFGTLSIVVRNCLVRGPDQPADQAVYLDITDSRDTGISFHGWMLLSSPSLSMLEHPVYDIQLTGCRL